MSLFLKVVESKRRVTNRCLPVYGK